MFERFLHQTPFFRLLLPFVLGIVFQIKADLWNGVSLYILLSSLLLSILFIIVGITENFNGNKIWGLTASVVLFCTGAQLVIIKEQAETYFNNKKKTFIATIIEQPEEKENSFKTTLRLDYFEDSSEWKVSQSKILCYIQKDSVELNLHLGDQVVAQSYINEIKHSGNPYTFNYKRYLKFQEIYNQCYLKYDQYQIINQNHGLWLRRFSNNIRQNLLGIYKQNNISGNEFAVLSALTLGYKNELTPELKESFSASGAMHVLAVSGLHVGIIYIILCKLLFFLQKRKYGQYLQSLIIIAILFFYALLTGLSDSVLRATIMFTFITAGKMFKRQLSVYNSIAASAFILLLTNPYSVMNVGFQLSYAAVISIVFFQPKIYALLQIEKRIPDYIWQLISVSIAAQIGTFPITIYYFDQFPLYFIITNIVIIPVVTLIIYSAFFLFIFSFSQVITLLISKIIYGLTWFLNKSILMIENLPYAKIRQISIDSNEVVLLLTLIVISSFFLISKKYIYLKFSFLLLLLLSLYNIIFTQMNSQKTLFAVHHIQDMSALHFIHGNKAHFICNQPIRFEDKNINYNIKPLWKHFNIDKNNLMIEHSSGPINYFTFKNKKFIHIKNNFFIKYTINKKLTTDFLILSENAGISINQLNMFFDFNLIIFDSSNSHYTVNRWKQECKQNNIQFYDVLNDGAFVEYL